MLGNSNTNQPISRRLQQDMNPSVSGVVTIPAPPAKEPEVSTEDIFAPQPEPAEELIEPAEILPAAEITAAPLISQVSDWRKSYLAWIASLLVLPPVIFWLVSLLYVAGAKTILLAIVTNLPFVFIVVANVALPIISIAIALYMLWRTEIGDSGRWLAKTAMALAVVCLLSLGWWLIAEVI